MDISCDVGGGVFLVPKAWDVLTAVSLRRGGLPTLEYDETILALISAGF